MIEIPLSRGLVALIDDADYERVSTFKWFARPNAGNWYGIANLPHHSRKEPHRTINMHRFILGLPPYRPIVDHIDGNGLNNQRSNLRLCAPNENQYNRLLQKNNTSGYKGVTWSPDMKKWRARIGVGDNKRLCLGFYATPEEAYAAYCEAAKVYHGEFARL